MTKTSSRAIVGVAMFASLAWSPPARGQDAEQQLGTVHFVTSCNQPAQQRFDRAMRYQHSFWYRASREGFEQVLQADPRCAMAYWGIALSMLMNPHVPTPRDNLALGLATLQKATTPPAPTARERDYIAALLALYTDHETLAHGARVQRYLEAMAALAERYPDDDEAQIGYALALSAAASPNDKTYANQIKGAAILEPIFRRQPRHPGVAHYLIHLYDYPPIAARGLNAAKRYAEIAPAAPHALHMPSHIFTRVGYWKKSIATNAASARAAKAGNEPHDQLHAMTTWSMPICNSPRTARRQGRHRRHGGSHGYNPNIRPGPFAIAASQARFMVERSDWRRRRTAPAGEPVCLRRRHHALRSRAGRGALRQPGRRPDGHREARRSA